MGALGRGRTQFPSNSVKTRGRLQFPVKSMKNRVRLQFPPIGMKISWNQIQKELIRRRKNKCGLSLLKNSAFIEDPFVKDFTVQGAANEEFFMEETPVTEFSGENASMGDFSPEDLIDQATALGEAADKSASKTWTRRRKIVISSYADLEREIQQAKKVPLKVTLSRKIPLKDAKVILKEMKKSELFDVINKDFLCYAVHELNRACEKLGRLECQLEYIKKFGGGDVNVLESEVERLRLLIGKPKPDVEKQNVAKGSTRKDSAKKHIGQDTAKIYASKHSSGEHSDKDIAEMASTKKLSHQQEGTVLVSSYSDLKREIKLALGGPLNVTLKRTLPLVDAEIICRKMKNDQQYRVVNYKFLLNLIHKLRKARLKLRVLKVKLRLLLNFRGRKSQEKITALRAKVNKLKLLTKRKK